jgi:hypothetical protein
MRIICLHGMVTFTAPNTQNIYSRELSHNCFINQSRVHTTPSAVTWDRLRALDVGHATLAQAMALRYGYDVPERYRTAALLRGGHERCAFRTSDGRWYCRFVVE